LKDNKKIIKGFREAPGLILIAVPCSSPSL
jgi:hypothetical protein